MPLQKKTFNRRRFLGLMAAGAGAVALGARPDRLIKPRPAAASDINLIHHAAWVWQFEVDGGDPAAVRDVLARNGMGVMLKTHDGTYWMSRWDKSPFAINGYEEVKRMAEFFESGGVPFHAWAVVKGMDWKREAEMCAEVLAAGARTMIFDLEPPEGSNYWQADRNAAVAFGQEMRRLAPNARLAVAPDARPWRLNECPVAEFAEFCEDILPQTYWETFDSPANHRYLAEYGFPLPPEGLTPEFMLDVTAASLAPFGRGVRPIGQGAANADSWRRFTAHANSLGMGTVSVWRYGTAAPGVWETLGGMRPAQPEPPAPPPPPPEPEPQQAETQSAPAAEEEKPQEEKPERPRYPDEFRSGRIYRPSSPSEFRSGRPAPTPEPRDKRLRDRDDSSLRRRFWRGFSKGDD